jgi:hypothetical protein
MSRMNWHRSSPCHWCPRDKYEPTVEEIARAAAKREAARRETAAGVKAVIIEPNAGVSCPRCGKPTERRTHAVITAKMKRKMYYRCWYVCREPNCRQTTAIFRDEDRVYADGW